MNHVSLLWTKTTFYALHVDVQTVVGMTRRWSPWAVLACLLPRKQNLLPQTTPNSSCSTIVYHNSGQSPGKLQLIMIYCCARHCRWNLQQFYAAGTMQMYHHHTAGPQQIPTSFARIQPPWDTFLSYIMTFHTSCLTHSEVLRRCTIEDTTYVCMICVHMFQV